MSHRHTLTHTDISSADPAEDIIAPLRGKKAKYPKGGKQITYQVDK